MKRYRVAGAAVACAVVAAVLALVAGAFANGSARAAQAVQPGSVVGTLTVQGLQGASSLELQSFSWGATNPTSTGSAGGGAGTGKVQLGELVVERAIDAVSPRFFEAVATGEHFPSAVIVLTSGKATTRYTLHTVFVTAIQHTSTGDGAVEKLSLMYGAIEIEAG